MGAFYMANGNKLYSAYRGAGKAAASYKASLYDIENLGIEREASQSMYQFETAQRDKTLALVQQGIGLASDLYGGYKAKQEAAADRTTIQEGMAKKAYEGDVAWDKLTDTARTSEIEKFAPSQVKRNLGEILTGSEKKYTFGEGGDEFTSSQITAASSLYGDDKLSELLGINKSSKIEALQEDFTESVDKKVESESRNIVGAAPELNVDLTGNLKIDKKPSDSKIPDFSDFEIPSLLGDDEDLLGHWAREPKGKSIKSFAKGGEFTTDGPEMILVGDNPGGKEKVKVKPIKSKSKKTEGQDSLSDNLGTSLKDLVSKKGTKPGSKKWMSNYIQSQKINNQSLRPLQGELSKHNKKLFSMAEESGYFGEFFRGGWE
jgi:hypothetical protein